MSLLKPSRRLFLARAALAAPALITCPKVLEAGWQSRDTNYNQNIAASGSLGLQTSLGSFWSLDNTLNDATGNVTALTNNNTVTFVSPPGGGLAAVTNCANFVSASSQYLSHVDATGINVAGIDFSISFWFYATTNNKYFFSKSTGAFGSRECEALQVFGSAFTIRFSVNNGTQLNSANTSGSAWHNCVITWNNTSKAQIVYIDGASSGSGTGSANPTGTSQLNIGADAAPANFFGGNIALFGIWRSRILSAGDVTLLYNGGAGLSYAAMA